AITGPRIAIVGAGPAGLAAAHDLTVLGADVALYDRASEPGGLLRSCIPQFRLPAEIVHEDVARILAMGMTFHPDTELTSLAEIRQLQADGFAAVLLALGGGSDRTPEIPGWRRDPATQTAIEYLGAVREDKVQPSARRVLVIGGGNAALDVARTALRRGAESATIVYRRDWRDMRALAREVEDARSDGVRFLTHSSVTEILWDGGRLRGARIAGAGPPGPGECNGPARKGSPRASDAFDGEVHEADAVLSAIGQIHPLAEALASARTGSLEREGIFCAGDFADDPSSVADAIASGRRASGRILAHLSQSGLWRASDRALDTLSSGWLDPVAGSASSPPLPAHEESIADALACLRCDYSLRLVADRCVLCGDCVVRCTEQSLRWTRRPGNNAFVLAVDDSSCTRCGDCLRACPVDALQWSLWTSTNRNIGHPASLAV
ncbi:MAG: FAD-dependent oxidoreductase, partial [Candidatus Eisenbacteria bacterium]|nr:FAD-dependent oxidoreductase [Candidatus Eisenbacteria bacterium]